jgi:hydroxymethylglutaryl-CoA lyase
MLKTAQQNVLITEVGPRDGLQNEVLNLCTLDKIKLIRKLAAAGIRQMEVTSFVSPKAVPNLADAEAVMDGIRDLDVTRLGLVANSSGYERALASDVDGITLVMSATESHNQANVRRSIKHSIETLSDIATRARAASIEVRLALSVVFGCPYEGSLKLDTILRLVETIVERGFTPIELCDTIGIASPTQVYDWVRAIQKEFAGTELELHLHDTYGRGLANVLAGLEAGITRFDASVGGLGGCPFAPGATGNVATEDVVAMLDSCGVATGIDVSKLLDASDFLAEKLERRMTSALWQVRQAQCLRQPVSAESNG